MKIHQRTHRLCMLCTLLLLATASLATATTHEGTHALANKSTVAKGGDFSLDGPRGPVALKQFRGKVVVLYFGYTSCPDACPTTLSALGAALKSMSSAESARVQPLFITLDPARDDATHMADYSRFFYPTMLGLRGSDAQLAKVAKQYGVLYAKQKVDSAANYVIDHSSFLYVIGPDGKLARSLPYGIAPDDIAAALRAALPPSHE